MKKQITAMLSSLLVLPGLVLVLFSHLTAALPTDSIRVTTPCNDTASLSAGHIGLPNELGAVLEKSKAKAIRLSDRNIDRMGLKQAAAIAQAARCPSVNQKKWQCGEACTSLPDIKLFWTYGDNREIPYSKHDSHLWSNSTSAC